MNSNIQYTAERNALVLLALLKKYGIRKVVASPGTTNKVFVWSLQHDGSFEMYSAADERSAAYIACGLAEESGEPVVITCTGATASRNYLPGLTEAYYRKLPIVAVTSHQGIDRLDNLRPQNIDRRSVPNDVALINVDAPIVNTKRDEVFCSRELNKALQGLKRHGGGPVHINLYTNYSQDFSVSELPQVCVINRITPFDQFPLLDKYKRIAITVGSHKVFTEEETVAIDNFCATYDAVVLCDQTSGYYGQYRAQMALVFCQENYRSSNKNYDLLIHIGEMSGDYYFYRSEIKEVWRVSEDGEMRDTWNKLSNVFEMPERFFFEHYAVDGNDRCDYLQSCKEEYETLHDSIPELPYSNYWMAQRMAELFPNGSVLHLGILGSLRAWNFVDVSDRVRCYSNVGGFGIDGCVSTLIGASLAHPERNYYGVFGDLAFFYDMNSLGNRHVGKNIRIMLVNNGRGTEFRNYSHDCHLFGDDADPFMAAAGHYGNQSQLLVKHYAEDLGFKYLTACNKDQFIDALPSFFSDDCDAPVIFEVFTSPADESNALKTMLTFMVDPNLMEEREQRTKEQKRLERKYALRLKLKNMIKLILR